MKTLLVLVSTLAVVFASQDVRLMTSSNTESRTAGRVEVLLDGKWGQVCSDGFSSKDAAVVCRSVNGNEQGTVESGKHGIGPDPIVIGGLGCSGNEQDILQCPYTRTSSCTIGTIAAVNCNPQLGATGSLGLEAGIIAAIIICLVAVIGILALLGTCLWRNDLCCAGGATA